MSKFSSGLSANKNSHPDMYLYIHISCTTWVAYFKLLGKSIENSHGVLFRPGQTKISGTEDKVLGGIMIQCS